MNVPAATFHIAAINTFLAGWTSNGTALRTPVKLENMDRLLTTVDGQTTIAEPPANNNWVDFLIFEDAIGQVDFGSTTNHGSNIGTLEAHIYVPRGQGTHGAKTLGDLAKAVLEKKVIAGVKTRVDEGSHGVGVIDRWYRYDVSVPYTRLVEV